ncbi:hypothetical protein M427DRAFT_238804 [Gonapodya prolifera JEL478]|uniref:Uncharacterized protein n=1 Tax=Gonapodya prolifera (strain JEL478) TaxID=1344416 RepID=A0A138ZXW8_GONPJ|nr:hypothetical protein M427DRAFT_238804 [Gonapodya prolifera JEL478]|eukprot:KXS09338.1 hypothetical protein M427DRAFT_238804 [Gonapodya prolifera JEL478]
MSHAAPRLAPRRQIWTAVAQSSDEQRTKQRPDLVFGQKLPTTTDTQHASAAVDPAMLTTLPSHRRTVWALVSPFAASTMAFTTASISFASFLTLPIPASTKTTRRAWYIRSPSNAVQNPEQHDLHACFQRASRMSSGTPVSTPPASPTTAPIQHAARGSPAPATEAASLEPTSSASGTSQNGFAAMARDRISSLNADEGEEAGEVPMVEAKCVARCETWWGMDADRWAENLSRC